ncbi:MAG: ribosome small subunit-dependent GTPase A [Monoglobales bacterium]|jgi:ribosome biogenesis GTPase|uniref:ribosome small subunit-dependent GTPase A n=1 Tax=Candidatus Ventrimonas sp. TaxID=3048889 RepID=UPI003A406846
MTGKIIKGIAGFYYVHDRQSRVYECKAKGIFRNRGIKPVVGDDVKFTVLDEESKEGSIDEILPRKNVLIRPASANVDQALVVFAVTQPEPNFNLLDRFLIMMEAQEIPVTICFNKTDLDGEGKQEEFRNIYESAGYQVLLASTRSQSGLDEIHSFLQGKTTILAGPSGVGKSSLTNLLQPEAEMETGSISQKIQRGKHTTRHAELFCVEGDTYLMDTPGFSSMYLEEIEPEKLKYYFPEFEAFESECRFLADCVHVGEPVCGVKAALERGEIARSRYDNYVLLYQELKNRKKY